jgi:drug/metabolite transporter (DMT)-like permease
MTDSFKGYSLGVLAAASYGTNPLFALPLLGAGIDAYSVLFLRYFFAIPMLALMMVARGRGFGLRKGQVLPLIVLGLLMAASSLTLYVSYAYIGAAIASTLLFIYPILTAIIMVIFFKEKVSWITATSILLAFVGIALLTRTSDGGMVSLMGCLLVFLSSLSYAIYIVGVNRSVLKKMDSSTLTFWALLFGSLLYVVRLTSIDIDTASFTFALQTPNNPWLWGNLVCLALFPTIISLVTMNLSIHYIGSTSAAILGALEPITALVIGLFVFGETLTPRICLGILLVLSAVTLLVAGKKLLSVFKLKD